MKLTEKTTVLREDGRTLVFHVLRDANKLDVKRAVESLLGAKVENVRTAMAHGKEKRQGRYSGRRPDWKKAYVRLRDGEKLPEFLQGA
jgi:large subunit ribosomal protein L23